MFSHICDYTITIFHNIPTDLLLEEVKPALQPRTAANVKTTPDQLGSKHRKIEVCITG